MKASPIAALLVAGAAAAAAYVLTRPRTHRGGEGTTPAAGELARIGDDVFVRATLPTLAGTPGLQRAAFASVRVENADPSAVFGRVRGLLIPEASGTFLFESIQGPAAEIRRDEIVTVERNDTRVA